MTDTELIQQAVAELDGELAELKQTTRGLKGYNPPTTSRWAKALRARQQAIDLLAQVGKQTPAQLPPLDDYNPVVDVTGPLTATATPGVFRADTVHIRT